MLRAVGPRAGCYGEPVRRGASAIETAATLIVGAGIVGSALAMHLAEMGEEGILVVDPDLAGALSSSERNAGGVRATWWQRVNIDLCARTIEYFRQHGPELGLRPNGYLWLYDPELWEGAREHVALQNELGLEVELLSPAELGARWPFIDRLDGVAGATFSPKDGLINPNAVKEHYRARARAAGARFLDRRLLVGVERDDSRVTAARLRALEGEAAAHAALVGPAPAGPDERVACERIVNAAGPWAVRVADLLGVPVPCRAVRRQLSLLACRDVDLSPYGMIVDSSGCYMHHEGGELFLAGYSPPGDPPGYRFDYDGRAFFEAEIWPRLAERISAMDRLEHIRGWAGLYELSPDNSALVGPVEGLANAFEIHSFSGRGVMQSYGAGLALGELIATGAYQTADASALAGSRFRAGALQQEELHI
jgi:FAD-dependent oxidoreductase domain-containing protein 1